MADQKKMVHIDQKKVERKISSIGAMVADAQELSEEINDLARKADKELREAQQELDELYISLDEDEKK